MSYRQNSRAESGRTPHTQQNPRDSGFIFQAIVVIAAHLSLAGQHCLGEVQYLMQIIFTLAINALMLGWVNLDTHS